MYHDMADDWAIDPAVMQEPSHGQWSMVNQWSVAEITLEQARRSPTHPGPFCSASADNPSLARLLRVRLSLSYSSNVVTWKK